MTMNNTIKSKFPIVVAAFMLAFLAVMIIPASTNACYDGGCYIPRPVQQPPVRPAPLPFSQPNIIQQPVYIQQPVVQPVYIQQPVVQPVYIQQPVIQPVYYSPLTVSCRANVNTNGNYNYNYNNNYPYNYNGYNNNSNSVTWTAYASGGNGNYSYSWSGSDGLYGTGQSVYFNYTYAGTKTAYVTVYSNGQSITQSCTGYVQGTQYVAPIVYQNPYPVNYVVQNNLDIGCYVDPINAKVNQPVTWSAEVTGGMAPYNYSWSGSDDLGGSQSSVTKFYNTSGSKSAIVTVTSADGKTGTRACSNSLAIEKTSSNYASRDSKPNVGYAPIVKPVAPNNADQTAAAMFSLSNIPWGWVAILVILVLFVTVTYLLFNRQKI